MTDRLQQALESWEPQADSRDREGRAPQLLAEAERVLADDTFATRDAELLREWLEITSRPAFLRALDGPAERERWTETAFAAIRRTGYSLEDMLAHRVAHHGTQTFLEVYRPGAPQRWSYAQIAQRVRGFAAALLAAHGKETRVALLLANCIDGACCDLACLLHDILVTPLNINFGVEELVWIFDRLRISAAVADGEERLQRLMAVRAKTRTPFTIYSVVPSRAVERGDATLLHKAVAQLSPNEIRAHLAARARFAHDEICTVMFTSGSTGRPKGVVFTPFNLISKRFARAAALPEVGDGEVLFSYLPLFHTFGRYLEMLGMLFWRGTYVFAANPSVETLLAGLKAVRPTGLIGVPQRWSQLAESCLAAIEAAGPERDSSAVFREMVGERLRWGLSAAGYLNPRIFRFFQNNGVALCSGFGMTEATGGITMSPPGDYVENTVGVALPGMRLRFTDEGEMHIGGAYVGGYLTEEGTELETEPALEVDGEQWLPTGDLFKSLGNGHVTLVDRIKDIYKNSRGQTIAPRRIEQLFFGVPGIKNTFLVGDQRAFNVLMIVPDLDDPVLVSAPDDESRREYFHQIVTAANQDLAPYERVINFEVLERDFSLDRGELTPKGSFRRKVIETNFKSLIDSLYETQVVVLEVGEHRVHLPRWFYRDLGILETDIESVSDKLIDCVNERELALHPSADGTRLRVGGLEYTIDGNVVDLGVFARQPRLWMGNAELTAFAPCKVGWDVDPGPTSPNLLRPPEVETQPGFQPCPPRGIDDPHLLHVNALLQLALYAPATEAIAALQLLGAAIGEADYRLDEVIRSRVAALATHPVERVRCDAYKVLLLAEPPPDDSAPFPAFIQSGLSFIDEESIEAIATASLGHSRLEALRKRMHNYRQQLEWPTTELARSQFTAVLRLLVKLVRDEPSYFKSVRAELAGWILHRQDPGLASTARELLEELVTWIQELREEEAGPRPAHVPQPTEKVVFDEEIAPAVREELLRLFFETTFLQQSIRLAFEEAHFELDHIDRGGIWIARLRGGGAYRQHRVSINTTTGQHFELQVMIRRSKDRTAAEETIHWMMVIAGYPFDRRVMPRFGCMWAEQSALAIEYIDSLTMGEKIREFAHIHRSKVTRREVTRWRKLYLRGIATFFRAWRNSGRRIVPGGLMPRNIVVPERDFHEGAVILSIAGWKPYEGPLALFRLLYKNFYERTWTRYPRRTSILDPRWLFDACIEGLGIRDGHALLEELRKEALGAELSPIEVRMQRALEDYLTTFEERPYNPLPVDNAIDRFHSWRRHIHGATAKAQADQLEALSALYHLDRFGEIARYHLYRHTFFAEAPPALLAAFDNLLDAKRARPDNPATQLVELSDLQAALVTPEDRAVFARLVFPRARKSQSFELMTFGQSDQKQLTVRTHMEDRRGERYDLRAPVDAEELGQLYRLFYQEQLPMHIGGQDRHLIVFDAPGQVVGGICYRMQRPDVAHIDGIVVKSTLTRRGLATGLLEDFVARMTARGVTIVKTTYMMRAFCTKRGFATDRRWGGLVRFITVPEPDLAAVDADDLDED